jgi:hypothetical protein
MANGVQPYAKSIGAETYSPDLNAPESEWMANNKHWINDRMDEGCTIIDCGASPLRDNYPNPTSDYYKMELDQIAARQYPNYIHANIR